MNTFYDTVIFHFVLLTIYFSYSYTAGIVGGLTTTAICAPNDKFLNYGGPLAMCLGFVFISSIGEVLSFTISFLFKMLVCIERMIIFVN